MAFPQIPYYVQITKVQVNNIDVSGVQYTLENITKLTQILISSDELDSNIIINLSDCGDWDLGDNIKIIATYYGKIASGIHQVVSGDNNEYDFGTLALMDVNIVGGGTLVNGGLVQ